MEFLNTENVNEAAVAAMKLIIESEAPRKIEITKGAEMISIESYPLKAE